MKNKATTNPKQSQILSAVGGFEIKAGSFGKCLKREMYLLEYCVFMYGLSAGRLTSEARAAYKAFVIEKEYKK